MMLKAKDLEFLRNLLVDKQEDLRVARDNVVTSNKDYNSVDLSYRTLAFIQFLVERELSNATRAYPYYFQPPLTPVMGAAQPLGTFECDSGLPAAVGGGVVEGPFSQEEKNAIQSTNTTQNDLNVVGSKNPVETICSDCSENNSEHTHCVHGIGAALDSVLGDSQDAVEVPIDLSDFIIKPE